MRAAQAERDRPAGARQQPEDWIDDVAGGVGLVRLVKRAGFAFSVQAIGAGLSFGMQVVLARLLGAPSYGVYAYTLVWVSVLALIAGLGLPAASVRFIPSYRATQDGARLRGFLRASSRLTFGTATMMSLCGVSIAVVLGALAVLHEPAAVIVGALAIPALAGSMLYTERARASGRVGIAFVPPLIARPALIGIGVAGLYVVHGEVSAPLALGAALCTGCVVLVIQYVLTRPLLSRLPPIGAHAGLELREWLSVGLTLLSAGVFTVVLMQIDLLAIGIFRGTYDAGLYSVASSAATLVGFVLLAVNTAAAPRFATLWTLGRTDELRDLVVRLSVVIFVPSLAIALVLAVLSGPLLGLFGPAFRSARWALLILIVGQLVNAGAGSVGYLLNLTGNHREARRALGWSAAICVVLAALGAWAFGMVGAAIASAIGFALWNGWLYWIVVRRLGLHPSILHALSVMARSDRVASGTPDP